MGPSRDAAERRPRLRRGSRTEARSLAVAEIHLEAPPSPDADPLEPLLDHLHVRRVANEMSERLVPEGADEWTDSPTDARLLVGQDRLLVRLPLPDEPREALAQRLDRVYDLVFDLASALRLEIVDPQVGTLVSRFRYEQQFQRFLDTYYTRARTAAALASPSGWKEFRGAGGVAAELPAIETEPESVPPSVWGREKRSLGVLEFAGERALVALAAIDDSAPFVALVPPDAQPGDDAAILRVRRLIHPVTGLALVDVATEGAARIRSIERDGALRLALVPRGS